jgi:hypothetical protein
MGKLEGMFSPFWHCYTQSFLKSDPSSLPRNASVIQTPPRSGARSVTEMARGFLISRSLTALRTGGFQQPHEMLMMHAHFLVGISTIHWLRVHSDTTRVGRAIYQARTTLSQRSGANF